MTSLVVAPVLCSFPTNRSSREHKRQCLALGKCHAIRAMRTERSLEELYNVTVERNVSKERLAELGVSCWSIWKTGKCKLPWDWHVDQLVYIEEGEVRVVPEGSERYMRFVAGDLVRYPKWFEADLFFNDFYQERYRFRAYVMLVSAGLALKNGDVIGIIQPKDDAEMLTSQMHDLSFLLESNLSAHPKPDGHHSSDC